MTEVHLSFTAQKLHIDASVNGSSLHNMSMCALSEGVKEAEADSLGS